MSVETFTDVSQLVDSVFKEMDCVAAGYGTACRGDQAAYLIAHDCAAGVICEAHLKSWLHAHKSVTGQARCTECWRLFSSAREMAQVYPL